jgi:hypothetical protein
LLTSAVLVKNLFLTMQTGARGLPDRPPCRIARGFG